MRQQITGCPGLDRALTVGIVGGTMTLVCDAHSVATSSAAASVGKWNGCWAGLFSTRPSKVTSNYYRHIGQASNRASERVGETDGSRRLHAF